MKPSQFIRRPWGLMVCILAIGSCVGLLALLVSGNISLRTPGGSTVSLIGVLGMLCLAIPLFQKKQDSRRLYQQSILNFLKCKLAAQPACEFEFFNRETLEKIVLDFQDLHLLKVTRLVPHPTKEDPDGRRVETLNFFPDFDQTCSESDLRGTIVLFEPSGKALLLSPGWRTSSYNFDLHVFNYEQELSRSEVREGAGTVVQTVNIVRTLCSLNNRHDHTALSFEFAEDTEEGRMEELVNFLGKHGTSESTFEQSFIDLWKEIHERSITLSPSAMKGLRSFNEHMVRRVTHRPNLQDLYTSASRYAKNQSEDTHLTALISELQPHFEGTTQR